MCLFCYGHAAQRYLFLPPAASRPNLAFNGHDHIFAHYLNANSPYTNFFTVGNGGKADLADLPTSASAAYGLGQMYPYSNATHGIRPRRSQPHPR